MRTRRTSDPGRLTYLGKYGKTGLNIVEYYAKRNLESTYCFDRTNPGPPYRRGGVLTIRKASLVHRPVFTYIPPTTGITGAERTYTGGFIVRQYGSDPGLLALPTDSLDLEVMGAKGWNKFRPGNPGAGLSLALAELRQLPTIPFRKLKGLRGLGEEYLNIEFGWLPLVRDIQAMYKTYRNLDRLLKQLRRDNGRGVRREGTVSRTHSVSAVESTGAYLYPILPSWMYTATTGKRTTTTSVEDRYWFSGRFRYWIPDIGESQWTRRATRALFGLNPTPDLLWNVLPWTWLIDWFANVGTVISNLSANAAENLAADYAFIMGTRIIKVTTDEYMDFVRVGRLHASAVRQDEIKLRQHASPFGFGLTLPDLSARQVAVLTALGISRRW